jgi:hypothetical protein
VITAVLNTIHGRLSGPQRVQSDGFSTVMNL